MGNGKWGMENGKWKMGNGKWKMGNGKWNFVVVYTGIQMRVVVLQKIGADRNPPRFKKSNIL